MIEEVKSWFFLDHLKDLSHIYWPGWKIPARGIYKASTPEQALGYAFKTSENRPIYSELTEIKKEVGSGLFYFGNIYFGDIFSVERLIPAELQDSKNGIVYWTSFSEEDKKRFTYSLELISGIEFFLDLKRSLETKKLCKKEKAWHFLIPEINNKLKKRRKVSWLAKDAQISFYEMTRRELEKFLTRIGAEIPSKYIDEIESFVREHSGREKAKVYYGVIFKENEEKSVREQLLL